MPRDEKDMDDVDTEAVKETLETFDEDAAKDLLKGGADGELKCPVAAEGWRGPPAPGPGRLNLGLYGRSGAWAKLRLPNSF